jgi:hypothetical protein
VEILRAQCRDLHDRPSSSRLEAWDPRTRDCGLCRSTNAHCVAESGKAEAPRAKSARNGRGFEQARMDCPAGSSSSTLAPPSARKWAREVQVGSLQELAANKALFAARRQPLTRAMGAIVLKCGPRGFSSHTPSCSRYVSNIAPTHRLSETKTRVVGIRFWD